MYFKRIHILKELVSINLECGEQKENREVGSLLTDRPPKAKQNKNKTREVLLEL